MTLLVIGILSFVQSLFGVGLLVFGTPLLLLLGNDFPTTISVLLPASLAISAMQTWMGRGESRPFARDFALWCLVPLVAALSLTLYWGQRLVLDGVVAAALLSFATLRLFPAANEKVRGWVARFPRAGLAVMGLVHGLSNLGGGLLVILASVRNSDKEGTRRTVAFCYCSFAAIQLAVLAVMRPDLFGVAQLGYAALSAAIFVTIGQRSFLRLPEARFQPAFTSLIGAFAVALAVRAAGII
jgi:uncharacterized membrane protein YfcA